MRRLSKMSCGLALLTAAGCATYEPVMVASPPPLPPSQVELVPAQPGPAYVWVPGYWAPRPGGYVWIEGHWRLR